MKVEEVKLKKTRGDIIVAGINYDGLSLESLYSFGIKKDVEITDEKLKELLSDSEKRLCKEKAFALVGIKQRTEKELRIKLYQKGFSSTAVKYALELLDKYGYLSDAEYAASFVETQASSKGAYRLKNELIMKGVSEECAAEAVGSIDTDEDERAREVAVRYIKGKPLDEKTRLKLFRHLASRGFNYDAIKTAVNSVFHGKFENED